MNTRRTLVSAIALGLLAFSAPACEGADADAVQDAIDRGVAEEDSYCGLDVTRACEDLTSHQLCIEDDQARGWTSCIDDQEADPCVVDDLRRCGTRGLQVCEPDVEGGVATWGACVDSDAYCADLFQYNPADDTIQNMVPYFDTQLGECAVPNTPLVLSFDGAPVNFTAKAGRTFDLTGQGQSHRSDWITAATPWLALDRNGNGRIDSGRELFGSAVQLATGGFASNGFVALAELDENGDGVIDENDAAFSELLVWRDSDLSRSSDEGEVVSAAELGLIAIRLDYRVSERCDERHNCERERSTFTFRDGAGAKVTGEVIDVHLR